MTKFFRSISVLEGVSFLVILSVSFEFISREYVYQLGMTHGILFACYLILSLLVANKFKWSVIVWLLVFLASLVPFAFIAVEVYMSKYVLPKAAGSHKD